VPMTCGIIFHAEADGPGTEGVSFWVERLVRRDGSLGRRFVAAGNGLESKPVVTRWYDDEGGDLIEDVEFLSQGYSGCFFLHDRKVKMNMRTKAGRGSIAFYNSSQGEEGDAHFSGVNITALRRGPMEIGGVLGRREKALQTSEAEVLPAAPGESDLVSAADFGTFAGGDVELAEEREGSPQGGAAKKHHRTSASTTLAPDSAMPGLSQVMSSTATFGTRSMMSRSWQTSTDPPTRARPAPASQPWPRSRSSPGLRTAPRRMASEGALRKNGGAVCGIKPASKTWSSGSASFAPFALNAPRTEMELVKSAQRDKVMSSSCSDFITM